MKTISREQLEAIKRKHGFVKSNKKTEEAPKAPEQKPQDQAAEVARIAADTSAKLAEMNMAQLIEIKRVVDMLLEKEQPTAKRLSVVRDADGLIEHIDIENV